MAPLRAEVRLRAVELGRSSLAARQLCCVLEVLLKGRRGRADCLADCGNITCTWVKNNTAHQTTHRHGTRIQIPACCAPGRLVVGALKQSGTRFGLYPNDS